MSDRSGGHAFLFFRLPVAFLVVSGLAGLVAEVVWARALAALFGTALPATGLLLSLFMGGLGVGAALGAKVAARTARPLAWFGAVEIAVGSLVLATPFALEAVRPWVASFDVHLPDGLALLVPAVAAVVILGPPVALMGATFPLFLAHVARGPGRLAGDSGLVYGLNTAGAVAGTLVAGFLLLPGLGIRASLATGASLDLLVGTTCLALGLIAPRITDPVATGPGTAIPRSASFRLATLLAFLGGTSALILEVAWFRALIPIVGSSVYALTLLLTAFLLGLALGATAFGRLLDRVRDIRAWTGRMHLLVAFFATLSTLLLQIVPVGYLFLLRARGWDFTWMSGGSLVLITLVLLPPTLFMGMALPAAIRLAADGSSRSEAGFAAGRVYAWSSGGSALGALAAAFLLVPAIGVRGTVAVAVALSLVAGLVAARGSILPGERRLAGRIVGVVTALWIAWAVGILPWSRDAAIGGYYAHAFLYWPGEVTDPYEAMVYRRVRLRHDIPLPPPVPGLGWIGPDPESSPVESMPVSLVYFRQGRHATISVLEHGRARSLLVNGKAEASNSLEDMRAQLLPAHLPVLMAPRIPTGTGMVIGFGSGVTAGALASWPLEELVVAEVEPAVVGAFAWFERENRRVLQDPRVTLRLDDGRRILDRTEGALDLLTSEPSNLWMSGVSLLFTREMFELARERLADDGVFCQWIHLYQISLEDVRILIATLTDVFPHVLAFADGADMLLMASRSPLVVDPEIWAGRLRTNPEAHTGLVEAGFPSIGALVAGLLADERSLVPWARDAARHTDDHPILEFTTPRSMARDNSVRIRSTLAALGAAAGPIELGDLGTIEEPTFDRRLHEE